MAHKQASIVDLDDEMDRFSIVAPSTIAEQELFKLPNVPVSLIIDDVEILNNHLISAPRQLMVT